MQQLAEHRVEQNRYRTLEENVPKVKARKRLQYAVKTGRVKPDDCALCGGQPTHGHHPDYAKPLDVVWLCKSCHAAEHRRVL